MKRRLPTPSGPADAGMVDGLAYTLWQPDGPPAGGLVVIHGADSRKENHYDMARAARASGFTAVCFDLRGHGESAEALDGRLVSDVVTVAALAPRPLALRGSSMGGYTALVAAGAAGAAAVIAICPASAAMLARGLSTDRFSFRVDAAAAGAFLAAHDEADAVAALDIPVLLLHAEGDEQVPVEHSRALAARSRHPRSRLIALPGGHHRSIQHDPELQGEALRWLHNALA